MYDARPASGARPARIYINNVVAHASDNNTKTIPAPAGIDFLVGNRAGGAAANTFFAGNIFDLRVYNAALSREDFAKLQVGREIATPPVLHMPFTDVVGGTAANIAGDAGVLGAGAAWRDPETHPMLMPFRARRATV